GRTIGNMRPSRLILAGFVFFMAVWTPPVLAQATSGSISGHVTDPSKGLVAGATVEARNETTGLRQTAQTDALGEYVLPALPPGSYTVTANKTRFTPLPHSGLELAIDQKMRVDFELKLGAVYQVETVPDGVTLQTQSAETGEVMPARPIIDL